MGTFTTVEIVLNDHGFYDVLVNSVTVFEMMSQDEVKSLSIATIVSAYEES